MRARALSKLVSHVNSIAFLAPESQCNKEGNPLNCVRLCARRQSNQSEQAELAVKPRNATELDQFRLA